MHLINKNSDYALRALIYLAKNKDRFISSSEISDKEGISLSFTRRILQELVKAGYLESREGAGGGVKISVAPEKIQAKDVINLFQGDIRIAECVLRKEICPKVRNCVIRKKVKELEKLINKEFENMTLQSLALESGGVV